MFGIVGESGLGKMILGFVIFRMIVFKGWIVFNGMDI